MDLKKVSSAFLCCWLQLYVDQFNRLGLLVYKIERIQSSKEQMHVDTCCAFQETWYAKIN